MCRGHRSIVFAMGSRITRRCARMTHWLDKALENSGARRCFPQPISICRQKSGKTHAAYRRPSEGAWPRRRHLHGGFARAARGISCATIPRRSGNLNACRQLFAAPTESATWAPRAPSGCGCPVVVSRAVWCSISALSSAPSNMTIAEIHIQVIKPITAPSDP